MNFKDQEEKYKKKTRIKVHVAFSVLIFFVIMIFQMINDESVINSLFTAAGYTYGPLLGLYAFGMFTKIQIKDKWAPAVCLISPILSFIINVNSEAWFSGYKFGFEILILNGILTFIGLLIISKR